MPSGRTFERFEAWGYYEQNSPPAHAYFGWPMTASTPFFALEQRRSTERLQVLQRAASDGREFPETQRREPIMKTLQDKVAVITGAGSGIGRGIALALADAGTRVVVADIQEASAQAVAEELRGKGVRSIAIACDVSRPDSVATLADKAYAEFGSVDILCNNAGVNWRPYRTILDTTLEDMQFIIGINFWGAANGLLAFLPRMRRQEGEKHIVNTSSIGGLFPTTGNMPYGASKAALAYMSEAIAEELAPLGFGVTVLCPGFVPTNITTNSTLLRGQTSASESRKFDPVDMRVMERFKDIPSHTPETVGMMVRNAILANTLYLHTSPLPSDLVAERFYTMYGPSTIGTAV
jgi:NAD(P)-dependent dehydrogenase (short-subunit alcohol dehydrogenase family)